MTAGDGGDGEVDGDRSIRLYLWILKPSGPFLKEVLIERRLGKKNLIY